LAIPDIVPVTETPVGDAGAVADSVVLGSLISSVPSAAVVDFAIHVPSASTVAINDENKCVPA